MDAAAADRAESSAAASRDRLAALGLWVAALVLCLAGLWQPALRDWDEGYTAYVALGMAEGGFWAWWYPTLWGQPFDKPPLIHGLVALSIKAFGHGEFAVRLPAALVSSLCVPMLYLVAREMRLDSRTALYAALVLLTLLPMLANARLAMLDAPSAAFMLVMAWCLLRAREREVMVWPAGAALMLMTMTKGTLGPLLGFCVLLALVWETPAMLRSWRLWAAMAAAGIVPAAWLAAQAAHFGSGMATDLLWTMGIGRVTQTIHGHEGPPWYYLLELLKFCWPWVALLPPGLWLALRRRGEPWAKFVLVFFVVYLGLVSAAGTKLPWYAVPLYPAFALACGVALAGLLDGPAGALPGFMRHGFAAVLALLAAACVAGAVLFGPLAGQPWRPVVFGCVVLAAAFAAAAWLLLRDRARVPPVLFGGLCAALFLYATDRDWNWQVNEDYPVKPVAALILDHVPPQAPVFIVGSVERPSLAFYARRHVPVAPPDAGGGFSLPPGAYVVAPAGRALPFAAEPVARDERWRLVRVASQ